MGASPPNTDKPAEQEQSPKRTAFEGIALLLLSAATIGTAWCSFQAATWGGISLRLISLSAAASRRAVVAELQYNQMAVLDVMLFSEYMNARAMSNEPLSRFYAERFRGEAKTAFEGWMATEPFVNPNAPPHPFVTNLYHPQFLEQSRVAEAESQQLWEAGGDAARTGRSYVLVTVLLASALFCGGTAGKFQGIWIRRAVLALGLTAFVVAVTQLWLLPVKL